MATALLFATPAVAAIPAPANDTPATAEVITTLPALIYGTTVGADDTITTIPELPAITTFVDGPDVFYEFTPTAAGTYRFQLIPWHRAPLRSSEYRFSIYLYEEQDTIYLSGARAAGSARPVFIDVALAAGTTYIFGVDHDNATTDRDNFPFTLVVDILDAAPGTADTCATAGTVPSTLPAVVIGNIDGAANDFTFTQGTGRCNVSGATPTTAPGIDHVYYFSPPADGDYAIDLVSELFDGVVYVGDSCPTFFPTGCLGAANHSTSGTSGGKHEFVVVTLEEGKDYWIYVDNGSATNLTGTYTLIVDYAENYEVTEVEPNDTPATASTAFPPLAGGQLVGSTDADYWVVSGLTGDRVYAYANNGGSSNSTLDTEIRLFGADGATLIEYDDDDGGEGTGPVNDFYFVYSTTSAAIAGAKLTSDGDHYLLVNDTTATGTVHRYRMHVGTQPASRAPSSECGPNDTIEGADRSAKLFFSGVIDTAQDRDVYVLDLVEGDKVFLALDGDPERDSSGSTSAGSDSLAFHGLIRVIDPDGDDLISDISDSNTAQTEGGDFPAQAGYFWAKKTGRHYVEVRGQGTTATAVGPTETYELAIFVNGERGNAALEDQDPVATLTPDYVNDFIDLVATDNGPGDTGICSVEIILNTNLQLVGGFTPGDPSIDLDIDLVDETTNGSGKVIVTDCAGNTYCEFVAIDVFDPICSGYNYSRRIRHSLHDPVYVPNNDLNGTTNGIIEIDEPGTIVRVNSVTVTIDAFDSGDIDLYLISPSGTQVELMTDRGTSLAWDYVDTTFTDSATAIVPILSSAAPFTGEWLPEDPEGLAKLIGEEAQGTWKLWVIDDDSSEGFGAHLVRWSLNLDAAFAGPETLAANVNDFGDGGGILSIELTSGTNVALDTTGFVPGDQDVNYEVTLVDPTTNGVGVVTVTDLSFNSCTQVVSLNGKPDVAGPSNAGEVTTDLTFKKEVEAFVDDHSPPVVSTITVPDSFQVTEVEVYLLVDADDQGRMAATLTHNGEFAALVNRIGMEDRGALGNTKISFGVTFDDDAPASKDIHMEPANGALSTVGVYQPDGRGDFIGDGIDTDPRDNMLFVFGGTNSAGAWDLAVGDYEEISAADNLFRRWALTFKNPCGPERYVGRAVDLPPGSGIQAIDLAPGATNLTVVASFTPGDGVVDYRIELVDPELPGSGTVQIHDGAGNLTTVPVSLSPVSDDEFLPVVTGSVNQATFEFEGTATELNPLDSGVSTIGLAPYADNLQIVSVTPALPASSADFVVGLIDPGANGRGYVKVEDACGHRAYILVEIDAVAPVCTGELGRVKRYFSGPVNQPFPDNNPLGVSSNITVADTAVVADVNITFNIEHGFGGDIDMTMTSPLVLGLFSDIGSTANDFIDCTLDDEAETVIAAANAPHTGSWKPEDGQLSVFDGNPANGTWTIKAVDDKVNDQGTFLNWSLLIESGQFIETYDGRASDDAPLDSGICSIELSEDSQDLVLTVDPAFVPGDGIVRYTVTSTPGVCGASGTVVVTDCAGNQCIVPIGLGLSLKGDLDDDGDVDLGDYELFAGCLAGPDVPYVGCECFPADFDDDGDVDLGDYLGLQVAF